MFHFHFRSFCVLYIFLVVFAVEKAICAVGIAPSSSDSQPGGQCFKEPIVEEYPCIKTQTHEEAYDCPETLKEVSCQYTQTPRSAVCPVVKEVVVEYDCFKKQADKKCWKAPSVVKKKCKKSGTRQQAHTCRRKKVEEVCKAVRYEVESTCYETTETPVSHTCLIPKLSKACAPRSDSCFETKVRQEAVPCVETIYQTECGNESPVNGYCPVVPRERVGTCYRPMPHKEPIQGCTPEVVCGEKNEMVVSDCKKLLPELREVPCKVERTSEVCTNVQREVEQTCYRDVPYEEEYDCSDVTWTEACIDFVNVIQGKCSKVVNITRDEECVEHEFIETCTGSKETTPKLCYREKPIEKSFTCYKVKYEDRCIG